MSCQSEAPLVPLGQTKELVIDGLKSRVKGEPCFDFSSGSQSKYGLYESMNDALCQKIGADQMGSVMGHGLTTFTEPSDLANDADTPAEVGKCAFVNNPKQPENEVEVTYEKTADPDRVFNYQVNLMKQTAFKITEETSAGGRSASQTVAKLGGSYVRSDGQGNTVLVTVLSTSRTGELLTPYLEGMAKKALTIAQQLD